MPRALRLAVLAAAVACLVIASAVPLAAQVTYRPTPPPRASAIGSDWYHKREPIAFAGNLYYRAGAIEYFDGHRMVPTGDYLGVPLYADTTLEPFSIFFVPVGGGRMQPYERRRTGELAGTTGSRTPSFPVDVGSPRGAVAAVMPFYGSYGTPAIEILALEPAVLAGEEEPSDLAPGAAEPPPDEPRGPGDTVLRPVGLLLVAPTTGQDPPGVQETSRAEGPSSGEPVFAPLVSVRPPERNSGIWIDYDRRRWHGAGVAIRLAGSGLVAIGEYDGLPVFAASREHPRVIYIPAMPGMVAPYELVRQ